MAKVLVIISTGFEEIEAISIIDILRRAEIEVVIATINDILTVGGQGIVLQANQYLKDIEDVTVFDMVVLPGGVQNTLNLVLSDLVKSTLQKMKNKDKYVSAICAAPLVLHEAKVLNKNFTCYPSVERKINSSTYRDKTVVKDEKVITSQGPGTSIEFALELVKVLKGESLYKEIKEGLLA